MKNLVKGLVTALIIASFSVNVQAQSKMEMKKDTMKMAKKKMDKMAMKKDTSKMKMKKIDKMKMKKDTSKMSKMSKM